MNACDFDEAYEVPQPEELQRGGGEDDGQLQGDHEIHLDRLERMFRRNGEAFAMCTAPELPVEEAFDGVRTRHTSVS